MGTTPTITGKESGYAIKRPFPFGRIGLSFDVLFTKAGNDFRPIMVFLVDIIIIW
jgi:hypothetical protein